MALVAISPTQHLSQLLIPRIYQPDRFAQQLLPQVGNPTPMTVSQQVTEGSGVVQDQGVIRVHTWNCIELTQTVRIVPGQRRGPRLFNVGMPESVVEAVRRIRALPNADATK